MSRNVQNRWSLRFLACGLTILTACATAEVPTEDPGALAAGSVKKSGSSSVATPTPTAAPLSGGVGVLTPTPGPGVTAAPISGGGSGGSGTGVAPTEKPATPRPDFTVIPTVAPTTLPVAEVFATEIRLVRRGELVPMVEPGTLSVDPGVGNTPLETGFSFEVEALVRYTDPNLLDKRLSFTSVDPTIVQATELQTKDGDTVVDRWWKLTGKKAGETELVMRSDVPAARVGATTVFVEKRFRVVVSARGAVSINVN